MVFGNYLSKMVKRGVKVNLKVEQKNDPWTTEIHFVPSGGPTSFMIIIIRRRAQQRSSKIVRGEKKKKNRLNTVDVSCTYVSLPLMDNKAAFCDCTWLKLRNGSAPLV